MRIKRTETKVYPLDELSDEMREKAIEKLADINVDFEWWESTFEDAAQVHLKITEFELDRGSYCRGEFIEDAKDTAAAIIENHGETCETHKTAWEFRDDSARLYIKWPPVKLDDDGEDVNEYDREQEQEELDGEFLKSILEDYRIILQKEYEYLTSEDAIIETIKANEYEFTADGKIA